MTKASILFVDNDAEFLKTRSEFLEQHGYCVFPAANPDEAQRTITKERIDLAVLDLRLMNDEDDKDFSGLTVAKESAPTVPKIILTRYPSVEAVREALGPALDGLPLVVEFVAKQEGPHVLLMAIRETLLENNS